MVNCKCANESAKSQLIKKAKAGPGGGTCLYSKQLEGRSRKMTFKDC